MSSADYFSLYYRTEDGAWVRYADEDHPDGRFTSSPVTFHAPGDGRYELYSVAGNSVDAEESKSAAEASLYVDTVAPTVTITSPEAGKVIGEVPLSIGWTADDQGSGIARTELSVDSGPWSAVSATSYPLGPLADGLHSATIRVTDHSGSSGDASVEFVVDPTAPEMTVSPIGSGAPLNATLVASFQEAVDPGSVVITVSGVSGELSWSEGDAIFAPSSPLEPERTYSVTVTGLKAGGQAFSVEWSFTTVENAGSVSGTVRDPDGHAVLNAAVMLSNGAATTTDSEGHFEFTGIIPGDYTLTVSGDGYRSMAIKVTVTAGQARDLGVLSVEAEPNLGAAIDRMFPALLLAVVATPAIIILASLRRNRWRRE
jgi:hypothetical protein